ncbi:MAG: Nif11 domain [Cyanobacteriota bacterium]|jgi:predicted ribosomally synthesized peptide with nif11-like leader
MSLASLEAFLEQAHTDQRLQELLCTAPDAASVAAIAQAAGYPVSELDLWQASGATPEDLLPHPEAPRAVEEPPLASPEGRRQGGAGVLPDPWLEEEPLIGFLHQAQGDEELQQSLANAKDAAAVAAIARAAGYPISELDLWRASEVSPEELIDPLGAPEEAMAQEAVRQEALGLGGAIQDSAAETGAWPLPVEDALLGFLHQAQGDEGLQEALANAPDAAAVAAIAQAAGYPISELDLWRASGSHAEEVLPPEPDLWPLEAPLARFLLEAEHDPSLQEALTQAEDAAAVAAIAQAAGYPITAADLWEASDALPEELLITEMIVFAVEDDLPN